LALIGWWYFGAGLWIKPQSDTPIMYALIKVFKSKSLVAATLSRGLFFDTSTKAGLGDTLSEWIGSKVNAKIYVQKTYTGTVDKLDSVTLLAGSDYGVVVENKSREKVFVNERVIGSITLR